MDPMLLSFETLLAYLNRAIGRLQDPRQRSNATQYESQVPLRETQPPLLVNWCELTLTRESDGKVLYNNAFTTLHGLVPTAVAVAAGR